MRFYLAIKAFFYTLRNPMAMESFLERKEKKSASIDGSSHLRLLTSLQEKGRLVDFLKEDLRAFSDAQIGAAVRKIHQDSATVLEELVTIRPLRDEQEGTTVLIPKGFDPLQIKLTGHVKGEPPYTGILVHRGWRAQKKSLPQKSSEVSSEVICQAEVEIKG